MLVRAKSIGYFGNKRIKEGQVFELVQMNVSFLNDKTKKKEIKKLTVEQQFSEAWMEKVDHKEIKALSKEAVKFDKEDNVEEIVI